MMLPASEIGCPGQMAGALESSITQNLTAYRSIGDKIWNVCACKSACKIPKLTAVSAHSLRNIY